MSDTSRKRMTDIGLLTLRLGVGVLLAVFIGRGKLMGGVEKWTAIGKGAMTPLGITGAPALWGFLIAFAECIGALFIAAGLMCRSFAFLLVVTMAVQTGATLSGSAVTVEQWGLTGVFGIVALSLLVSGPGLFSIDRMFARKPKSKSRNA